ncbi:three-helix bundle dimerization domain-containing protein [Nocardia uniformis]|uniref:three-helix bundle dimerization domain-containing protein n=1 Tax=Nocardia uniformis TaxID=53432 RepID=UPI001BB2850A|nr:hypothetical protein [Nocardia uniformis]
MVVAVDTGREEKALRQVRERLVDAYGEAHSAERVEAVVGAVRKRFDGHRIREFVPILVERIVRRELETRGEVKSGAKTAAGDREFAVGESGVESTGSKGDSAQGGFADASRRVTEPVRGGGWRAAVRDRRVLAGVAATVVVVVGGAVAVGSGGSEPGAVTAAPAEVTAVRGVVGSEKTAFFADPRVVAALDGHGLQVVVDPAGSRQIATSVDLTRYDFAFPSSAAAAERIQRQSGVSGKYTPFSSPMAIATFQPIVDLLVAAGVVTPGPTPILDMGKYLDMVERGTQWDELPDNSVYPVRKHVLISTTDPRTSNSAAMYLSVAAHVANENSIVRGTAAENHALSRVSRLFTRQGYTENSSDGPFQEYLATGMGTTPLVWIYESQFVDAAVHGQLRPDMVLLYPSPTVMSQHTVVPLNGDGDRLGAVLSTDPELQQLAAEYGFRTTDPARFTQIADEYRVPVTPQLIDVVDMPSYETLERLLDGVAESYN